MRKCMTTSVSGFVLDGETLTSELNIDCLFSSGMLHGAAAEKLPEMAVLADRHQLRWSA